MNNLIISGTQDIDLSAGRHAELVTRAIEHTATVQRRSQFFVWQQSYLNALLPHDLAVCASWQRARKDLVFEAFNSVPLPRAVLDSLANSQSALVRELMRLWVAAGGSCIVVRLERLRGAVPAEEIECLAAAHLYEFMTHGVARPYRTNELESLFVLAASGRHWSTEQRASMELVMPHLHSTYVRVQINERELNPPAVAPAPAAPSAAAASPITARERQILRSVREGKTNAAIAEAMYISPLTVKNHVQKILRKLQAANRAQAVAKAIQQDLL